MKKVLIILCSKVYFLKLRIAEMKGNINQIKYFNLYIVHYIQ